MYEEGEDDYSGLPGYEEDAKRRKKRIALVVGGTIGVLVIVGFSIALGFWISALFYDSDCDVSTNTVTVTVTVTQAPDATVTPTPSVSPTIAIQTNTNEANKDININYYQTTEKHPFSVYDLVRCDRIDSPVPSPDGTLITYTRYVYNPETNQTSTTLWLYNSADDTNMQLTPFGWGVSEGNPCWSPNGDYLVFISNRDPANIYYPGSSSQIWQLPVPAGASLPTPVSSYPMSVNQLMCSSVGDYLAVGMNIIPGMTLQETAQTIAQAEAGATRAFTYDKLFIRHWGEWFHGERNHPFIQAVDWSAGAVALVGEPVDALDGIDSDAPTKPYGGIEEWSFSPDDTEFAFTRRHDEESSVAWTTNLDIYLVSLSTDAAGAVVGAPTLLTGDNSATDTQPAYSPDGNYIAYMAQTVPGYESDKYDVVIFDRNGNTFTKITATWMYSVDSVVWDLDSSAVIVTAGVNATGSIFRIDLSGNREHIVTQHYCSEVSVLPTNEVVFSMNAMTFPANVYKASIDVENDITQLTTFNEDLLNDVYLSEPIRFSFTGANNDTVWGWVLNAAEGSRPAGQTSFPVAFLIHGGPQSDWADNWSYRWNPQTYAGHGYAVVVVDFHGSTSYGQSFTDSINNDYGGKPFYDLNTGLDYAISQFSFIDGSNQVALGASYGGWMINWINGHTWNGSNRFKCLVCHDGIFDQRIFWYDTDELWFPEHDMDGNPLGPALANYEQWNPANFTNIWVTPELVIHGGRDYRIADTHGIGAFTALQRQGIPSKFAYFPTENHWVLTPANSIYWHETVQDWIDSYAYPDGN